MGNANAKTTERINQLEGKLANANKSIKELMEKHEPHALELGKLHIKNQELETNINKVKKGLEKLTEIQKQAETKSYKELTELANKVEDLADTVDSLHPDSEKWENFEQGWEKTIRDLKDWVEKTVKESARPKKMAAPPTLMSPMSMSQSGSSDGSSDSSQGSGSETNDSTPTRTPRKAAGPFFDRKSEAEARPAKKPPLMKKRSFLSFLGVSAQPVHAHPE